MLNPLITKKTILQKIKEVTSIALYSVRQRIFSSHTICLFVLMTIYVWSHFAPIGKYADSLGVRVNPFAFTFFSSNALKQFVIFAGVIFLFSDAPFINITQPYVIVRSKRNSWALGQTLHVIIYSGMFFLILTLLSVVILLPNASLEMDGWGKVLKSLSQPSASMLIDLRFGISDRIMSLYSPPEAFALCFLLNWCMASFLGMFMFVFTLATNKILGILSAGVMVIWDMLVYNTFDGLERYSPLSLSRLDVLDTSGIGNKPSVGYAFSFFIISIAILTALSIILVRKRPIEAAPEQ